MKRSIAFLILILALPVFAGDVTIKVDASGKALSTISPRWFSFGVSAEQSLTDAGFMPDELSGGIRGLPFSHTWKSTNSTEEVSEREGTYRFNCRKGSVRVELAGPYGMVNYAVRVTALLDASKFQGAVSFDGSTVVRLTPESKQKRGRVMTSVFFPPVAGETLVLPVEVIGEGTVSLSDIRILPAAEIPAVDVPAMQLMRQLSPASLQWPLGGVRDWRTGMFPLASAFFDRFGIEDFKRLCEGVKAEPVMWINMTTNSPPAPGELSVAEAGEWVAYCKQRQMNVRRWRIASSFQMTSSAMSPEEYGRRFLEYARAMRAKDTSIKLTAIGGNPRWDRKLLQVAGEAIDRMELECWPHVAETWPELSAADLDLRSISSKVECLKRRIQEFRRMVRAELPQREMPVDLRIMDEGASPTNARPHFTVATLHMLAKLDVAVETVSFAPLADGVVALPGGGPVLTPLGETLLAYRKHMIGERVAAESASPALDILASRDPSGRRLSVAIFDGSGESKDTTQVRFDLGDWKPERIVEWRLLNSRAQALGETPASETRTIRDPLSAYRVLVKDGSLTIVAFER